MMCSVRFGLLVNLRRGIRTLEYRNQDCVVGQMTNGIGCGGGRRQRGRAATVYRVKINIAIGVALLLMLGSGTARAQAPGGFDVAGKRIGRGWTIFDHVFGGENGVIYARTSKGDTTSKQRAIAVEAAFRKHFNTITFNSEKTRKDGMNKAANWTTTNSYKTQYKNSYSKSYKKAVGDLYGVVNTEFRKSKNVGRTWVK